GGWSRASRPAKPLVSFLYLPHAVPGEVVTWWHAEWSVAKRRVPPRATARTALQFRTEPIRREQPSASCALKRLVWTCAPAKRPQPMPSGETAPSSASTGTGWGCGGSCVFVCSRARSTGACMAPIRGKCIMHEERRWFVGIDWASEEHVVSLCDVQGKKIGQRKFAHGGTGLNDMIDWLLKASGGEPGEIHVAIETPHGPIVEALLERGFNVYSINPKQLDRFRDRFTVAGAKDDSLDAYVLADSLRTDMPLFRKLSIAEPLIVELREWSRIDEELKVEHLRLANRLRDQLWRYYPQMLELEDDLGASWFLDLWEACPQRGAGDNRGGHRSHPRGRRAAAAHQSPTRRGRAAAQAAVRKPCRACRRGRRGERTGAATRAA